jgi:hypothetical protein
LQVRFELEIGVEQVDPHVVELEPLLHEETELAVREGLPRDPVTGWVWGQAA